MLADYFIKNNVSVYSVSKQTGIPYTTLNDLVMEKTDIKKTSADTLYRLSKYFKLSMEVLYNSNSSHDNTFYLYNEGRNIIITYGKQRYSYLGPKNLFSFHRINKIQNNVIYVETYFIDESNTIYLEEDYIDLADVLKEYGDENLLAEQYKIILKNPTKDSKISLIDKALLVSDNFAMEYVDNSTEFVWIKATNLSRKSSSITVQLIDEKIISCNMSEGLKKRALAAISRNTTLLEDEINERKKHNA